MNLKKKITTCTLDPSIFSHEAHLRLAWVHIGNYGLGQAKENIQKQLQDFVAHVGAKDKYHKTLTVTAIQTVYHFMKKSKADNFKDFITEFPQLNGGFKSLINSHYSFDIFSSNKAKSDFIPPDLMPFD